MSGYRNQKNEPEAGSIESLAEYVGYQNAAW